MTTSPSLSASQNSWPASGSCRARDKPGREPAVFLTAELEVDLVRRRVSVAGQHVRLSRREYHVLKLLVTHPGQVLTHQQILKDVYGPAHSADTHYLGVLIGHLRQKLGDDPSRPRFILTEQGVGYRLIASR
jgi:two-component system KDP operon response regulator KdpE